MWFLYILFTLICIILGGIILLQEGKGGGIGAAFGGVGGEAFGHGAGGVNKFTAVLAVIFLGLALIMAMASSPDASLTDEDSSNGTAPYSNGLLG